MRVWGVPLLCVAIGCASSVEAPVDAGIAAGPTSSTQIARACLLAVGCAAAPVGSLGACVQSMTRRALAPNPTGEDVWDRLLECAARPVARAGCGAFVDCATRGHPAAYCAAHPGDSCDGAFAVHCGEPGAPATARDCATIPGATCASRRAPLTGTYCRSSQCSPTCAGDVAVVSCAGAPDQPAERCTAGTSCVISPTGGHIWGACLPPGPACAAWGARCEGSVLVRCYGVFETVLLRETRSDCARLGWQCVAGVPGGATCVPPPYACALDAPPACEGDTLVACAAGSDPRFDCRALGFSRCAPASKSHPASCEP